MVLAVGWSVLLAGCADESTPDGGGTTGPAGDRPDLDTVGADEFLAACLTDETEEAEESVDLCIVDLDGRVTVVRPDITEAVGPAASPDGTQAAFIAEGQLVIRDLAEGSERTVGPATTALRWRSADQIVLVADDSRSLLVVTPGADLDSAPEVLVSDQVLTDQFGEDWKLDSFDIAPDGSAVVIAVFQEAPDGNEPDLALATIDLVTMEVDVLEGPGPGPVVHPAFSPDGQSLAYIRYPLLAIRDLDARETTTLGPDQWIAATPTWSADSAEILWLANGAGIPQGPALIVTAPLDDPDDLQVIVGNEDSPLDRFPAFPDRPRPPNR